MYAGTKDATGHLCGVCGAIDPSPDGTVNLADFGILAHNRLRRL